MRFFTLALLAPIVGCTAVGMTDIGPMKYDASGTMQCSDKKPTFNEVCGWRVLRHSDGSAELWISNIAVSDTVAFRVLEFANGEFADRDGVALNVTKSGKIWTVSVPSKEYYRFPNSILKGN